MEIKTTNSNLVPPDGGWGWVVCLAYALNNIIVLPLISGFGLIFQQSFTDLGISATQTSIILNFNHAFGMFLSFFNGPLLRSFGYRKVAISGALFITSGVIMTSYARSFTQLILTYSIFTSIGIALAMSSFTFAIHSFFREKRGRAMGLAMSITGLGTILMPQLMNALIESYGIKGAILILGALCLHSLVGAFLLRPAKWYMVEPKVKEPEEPLLDVITKEAAQVCPLVAQPTEILISEDSLTVKNSLRQSDYISEDEEGYLEGNKSTDLSTKSLRGSATSLSKTREVASHPDIRKVSLEVPPVVLATKVWGSMAEELNVGSSISIFADKPVTLTLDDSKEDTYKQNTIHASSSKMLNGNSENIPNEQSMTIWYKFVKFFDLELLRDPIFVNMIVGMSIAAGAEINFSLLTPFILKDLNFSTSEIAAVMSVIAFSDIIFRLVSPFIGDWCHKPPRVMYLASLCMIIFTRSTIFFASSYKAMLLVALGLGIAKGVRTVYINLVIPSYVPIERLPFASGIQMLTNGVILLMMGPISGIIRDRSGSYTIPIIMTNFVTFITVVIWSVEFIYVKQKRKPDVLSGAIGYE